MFELLYFHLSYAQALLLPLQVENPFEKFFRSLTKSLQTIVTKLLLQAVVEDGNIVNKLSYYCSNLFSQIRKKGNGTMLVRGDIASHNVFVL